ncbi:MAG: glycosyltransferase family 1 protein, partial [Planctomycetota bacterium]|nr:glycosyltransferase family 1 protein [Planctomycetota bacterium]
MRIGIDFRPALASAGGIGVYVRELTDALAALGSGDSFELFGHRLRQPSGTHLAPAGARLRRRRVPAPVLALASRAGYGADRMLGGVDVLLATDYAPLRASRAPLVATIHDVCFHTLPACYPARLRRRLARVTADLVQRAVRILVPTERVRAEVLAHTAAEADRVRVVPHGVPVLPAAAPATDLGRYVLFLSTVQPRKNLGRLLDAFEAVRVAQPDARLVVAGPAGWDSAAVIARAQALPGVTFLGAVDRTRAAALVRGAAVLAYPSLGEGFGLPVLEGLAAGVPVL